MKSIVLTIAMATAMLAGTLAWPDMADARPRSAWGWYGGPPVRYYYRPYYAYPRYYAYPYRYAYRYWDPWVGPYYY